MLLIIHLLDSSKPNVAKYLKSRLQIFCNMAKHKLYKQLSMLKLHHSPEINMFSLSRIAGENPVLQENVPPVNNATSGKRLTKVIVVENAYRFKKNKVTQNG